VCPYSAITMKAGEDDKPLADVNTLLCTGCGKCQVVCPTGAMKRKHFTTEQIEAELLGLIHARKRRETSEEV
ncbi:MAG: 4Fe-4S binding protein, partial [Promethearchaeota archaeon]